MTMWHKLMMSDAIPVKTKNYQHHFHSWVTTVLLFWHCRQTTSYVTCNDIFQKFLSTFEWSNSSWLTVIWFCFWSSVSRHGTYFSSSVILSKSCGTNFYNCLLLQKLRGQLGDSFHELQHALSDCDYLPLKLFCMVV